MPAPKKYDQETQGRAVRMYADPLVTTIHTAHELSRWGTIAPTPRS